MMTPNQLVSIVPWKLEISPQVLSFQLFSLFKEINGTSDDC
jgi:hypothetical protein